MKRKKEENGFFNFFGLFAVIAFLAVGTVIIDALSCNVNIFFYCNNGGGGGGGNKPPVTVPVNPGTTPTTNQGANQNGQGTGGGVCFSAANAVCGIKNQGTLVGGVCNATVPPNSSCPAPVIANGTGFYADPALVRSGNRAILHWSVSNATSCSVSGGGVLLQNLGIIGSTDTAPVNTKTSYTLTCINGSGGPTQSANTTVNLVPSFQEI